MRPTLEMLQVMVPFLASTAATFSGYDVMKRTGLQGGTCYKLLHRLSGIGWLTCKYEISNPRPGFSARTMYVITPTGKTQTIAVLSLLKVST